MQQIYSRTCKTIMRLQIEINKMKDEMNSFDERTFDKLLENSEIPKGLCELNKEKFLAVKVKNFKNRCYSKK